MTHDEFVKIVGDIIEDFIQREPDLKADYQLMVNPYSLAIEIVSSDEMHKAIELADEVIENAALAERPATEDADDFQAQENPDFYPLRTLIRTDKSGKIVPDKRAIARVAKVYELA